MQSYIRIRLFSVPAHLEDVITTHSFDCGATGLTEVLAFTQPDLTYDPSLLPVKSHDLDVYFEERPGCEFFDKLIEWSPNLKWEISEEENKDWLALSFKAWAQQRIKGVILVKPLHVTRGV